MCLKLYYALFPFSGLAVECGGFSSKSSGWLSAPKEDNDTMYVNNADCLWILEVFVRKVIKIQFLEMDIEEDMVCEYDYIKVCYIRLYSVCYIRFYNVYIAVCSLKSLKETL